MHQVLVFLGRARGSNQRTLELGEEAMFCARRIKPMLSRFAVQNVNILAIEAGLQERDWASVRRYANRLEAYTSAEPLPWTDMLIKRARLLADVGESGINKAARASLESLRAECQRMNAATALAAIENALS